SVARHFFPEHAFPERALPEDDGRRRVCLTEARPALAAVRRLSFALSFALSLVVALTTPALAAPPKAPAPHQKSPNIILITLDTTRADRMGFLGSKRGLTPNLDALARQSAVFTRAYAQVPLTPTSHASILTGTYPQYHQVATFGNYLAAD